MQRYRRAFYALNVLADWLLTALAYVLAVFVRFDLLHGSMPAVRFLLRPEYLLAVFLYSLCIPAAYAVLQLYKLDRPRQIAREMVLIWGVDLVGILALTTALSLAALDDFSNLTIWLFYLFSSLLVSGRHLLVRCLLRHYRRHGYNQKRVIVVGSGHLACEYMKTVDAERRYGFLVIGYVARRAAPGLPPPLGSYEALESILEQQAPDEVVIALDAAEVRMMSRILPACEKQGVRTGIVPFYNDYLPTHPQVEVVGNTKLINVRTIPLDDPLNALFKRTVDIVGSLAGILLFSPVMLAIAVGVKLTSPGPVLFRQERIGLNKKPFQMLKFRSMRNDADHEGWTTGCDSRRTRFGSWIRKFSLDELPQFFNVLKGDMSLVGPRPELPCYVEEFKEEVPLYLVRQQVRPGMTGWAQVNGCRGDTSIAERVRHDIWYIENWTWLLDARILLRTIFGGMINREELSGKPPQAQAGPESARQTTPDR